MSNISTFGTYTMARLGIYSSQKALDITGNNISNINTPGYTRQSIDQISLNMGSADRFQSLMSTRVGSGSFVVGVEQTRDQYLDIRYRDELSNYGYMDKRSDSLKEVAAVLDEVGKGLDEGGVMEKKFSDLVSAMEQLAGQGANRDEYDTLVRSAASSLVDQFRSYSSQLSIIAENQTTAIKQDVDEINTILTRIQDLNVSIRKTQIYGGNALEQLDARNTLIDELSEFMKIDISYEEEHVAEKLKVDKLVIRTSDLPQRELVNGIYATQLAIRDGTDEDGTNTFDFELDSLRNPNGKILRTKETSMVDSTGAPVNDQSAETLNAEEAQAAADRLSEEHAELSLDDDGFYVAEQYEPKLDEETGAWGILKTVTRTGKASLSRDELYGKLKAARDVLTGKGVFSTAADLAANPDASVSRGIPFYQKALDVLANTFATMMNNFNYNATVGTGQPHYLISNNGTGNEVDPPITASNIAISANWANGSLRIHTSDNKLTMGQSTDNLNLDRILLALTGDVKFYTRGGNGTTINPASMSAVRYSSSTSLTGYDYPADEEVIFTGSFQDFLTTYISGSLAHDRNTADTMLTNYETLTDSLYVDRDAVMGVDLNDEAMNMMMYQKSYSAACRLMTVYDGLLDRLINGTGA